MMGVALLDELVDAVRASWSRHTSNDPDNWSPNLPEVGQCAVSALVVQSVLGGDLLRAKVGDVSHYWNLLPGGREVDLTRGQFDTFEPVDVSVREREYVLSFPDTADRYRLLWSLVTERLGSD
ncbi:YunG family protein, partial [Nocardioides albidus]|uniref:YunG family protein n=1 Tax=Nocardioides albidus TaxID=1517589 RepID=UPI00130524E3